MDADLYAKLRDKYSFPSRLRGDCHGCPDRFEPEDPITLFGGHYYHANCLDDAAYMRLASVRDIAPDLFEECPEVELERWLSGEEE